MSARCHWMNLGRASKGLSQNHPQVRFAHYFLQSLSVITFSQGLVVLLHMKSTPAPSSYQVFKSSNLHLNKSQSLHTCKQSTRNPMLMMKNILLYLSCNDAFIFLFLYYKDRLVHRISGRTCC